MRGTAQSFPVQEANEHEAELMLACWWKATIEHAQKQLLDNVELTAQNMIKDILATRQRCVENGDYARAVAGRLKCDELLGRYLKMWEEKVENNFTDTLLERLQKARKQVGKSAEVEEPPEPKALPPKVEPEPV